MRIETDRATTQLSDNIVTVWHMCRGWATHGDVKVLRDSLAFRTCTHLGCVSIIICLCFCLSYEWPSWRRTIVTQFWLDGFLGFKQPQERWSVSGPAPATSQRSTVLPWVRPTWCYQAPLSAAVCSFQPWSPPCAAPSFGGKGNAW